MSREIKFRVWDSEENKYFVPIYDAYKGNLLDLSISLSGELLRRTLKYPSEHESRFRDRYKVEQYTGLKDKNGKEIYEGDIIIYCGIQEVVKYESNTHVERGHGDSTHTHTIGFSFGNYGSEFVPDELEVIGNVHENPELLK